MNKELMKKIDAFIKDKRNPDGDSPEVQDQDIYQLSAIMKEIVAAKYQKDYDWDIIDRTKYEPQFVLKVPYRHKNQTGHFKALSNNLNYYSDRLDRFCRHGDVQLKEDS